MWVYWSEKLLFSKTPQYEKFAAECVSNKIVWLKYLFHPNNEVYLAKSQKNKDFEKKVV